MWLNLIQNAEQKAWRDGEIRGRLRRFDARYLGTAFPSLRMRSNVSRRRRKIADLAGTRQRRRRVLRGIGNLKKLGSGFDRTTWYVGIVKKNRRA